MILLPSLNWIRIGLAVAAAVAIAAGVAAVRSHWIGVGEARVQAAWDKQQKKDAELGRQLELQRRAEENAVRRNAERIADEDHRLQQAHAARLADARRTVAGLLDAVAKLDADDLSAAAADPRVASVARRAIAARGLLGECSERYTALAGRANRLRDQASGLRSFAMTVCMAGAPEQLQPGGPALPADEAMKEVNQ